MTSNDASISHVVRSIGHAIEQKHHNPSEPHQADATEHEREEDVVDGPMASYFHLLAHGAAPHFMDWGLNAYQRDELGIWRYPWGDPVPGATTTDDGRIMAPELMPYNLLDIKGAAEIADVQISTLRSQISRKRWLEPTFVIGHTQLWSLPLLSRWLEVRRLSFRKSYMRKFGL